MNFVTTEKKRPYKQTLDVSRGRRLARKEKFPSSSPRHVKIISIKTFHKQITTNASTPHNLMN